MEGGVMASKHSSAWRLDRREKFLVLHRDGFACRYCSARPGSDLLEVDHLVPRAKGGADCTENYVTACKTCNSRKSDSIVFPHDLIERQEDDGWFVYKTFGEWWISFCPDRIGIDNDFGYGFIDSGSWPDRYWWAGIHEKTWPASRVHRLHEAVDCFSRLVNVRPMK
jgi:hypothetical protein